ncbi:MAG: hypothetical protein ACQEQF_00665 [Bacillota bacterium]
MKIEDIIIDAQTEIDRQINSNIAIKYINNITRRLAVNYPTAREIKPIIIESNDSLEYHDLTELVDSVLKVNNVKYADNLYKFTDYEVEDKKIRFFKDGKYKVRVAKIPDRNGSKTEEANIRNEYHVALSKWVAHKELSRLLGANYEDSKIKEEEFWVMVREIDTQIDRLDKKPRIIKAPKW